MALLPIVRCSARIWGASGERNCLAWFAAAEGSISGSCVVVKAEVCGRVGGDFFCACVCEWFRFITFSHRETDQPKPQHSSRKQRPFLPLAPFAG